MNKKKRCTVMLFFLPIFLGTFVFFVLPFGMVVSYSFGLGGGQSRFVGLENYEKVLHSEAFLLAYGNTAKFLLLGVPLLLALALGVALLLRQTLPFQKLCGNTILIPLVLPISSIVMVVEWLIPASALESSMAFPVLLLLYLWKNVGYVTLPLLKLSLVFSAVIGVINSFKSYREAFLLGGRHPHESIYMLQHFLNNNFENLNYARLAVASVLTALPLVVAAVIVLAVQRFSKRS